MEKISFILPSYNALEYLQWAYNSIRTNLSKEHEIVIVDDGSKKESLYWITSVSNEDNNLKYHLNGYNIGIAYTYNQAINIASNEIICMLHSDMYIPKGFDVAMLNGLKQYDVVSSIRIEPPLYAPSKDKILKNFGTNPNHFNEKRFHDYINKIESNNLDNTIFFPWMTTKTIIKSIGGMDLLFLKYMVDDVDFYYRLVLKGKSIGTISDTAVYHIPSRSSKFTTENDSREKWEEQHLKSTRNFVRKFKLSQSKVVNSEMGYKKNLVRPYIVMEADESIDSELLLELMPLLDIFSDELYINNEKTDDLKHYIKVESNKTLCNLNEKFKFKKAISYDEVFNRVRKSFVHIKISNHKTFSTSNVVQYFDGFILKLSDLIHLEFEHIEQQMNTIPYITMKIIDYETKLDIRNKLLYSTKTNIL